MSWYEHIYYTTLMISRKSVGRFVLLSELTMSNLTDVAFRKQLIIHIQVKLIKSVVNPLRIQIQNLRYYFKRICSRTITLLLPKLYLQLQEGQNCESCNPRSSQGENPRSYIVFPYQTFQSQMCYQNLVLRQAGASRTNIIIPSRTLYSNLHDFLVI